ncbi:5004_t:CDS:2 [Diversispora eburnea]|uniref:5004_t:CDS:1 n=1 Tax=Diversispora eburnea TaxID=1213867 RepID=A0A9N9FJP5_9GLOM|nr:5004_t:CDS:2 [Diversispora eburnea]
MGAFNFYISKDFNPIAPLSTSVTQTPVQTLTPIPVDLTEEKLERAILAFNNEINKFVPRRGEFVSLVTINSRDISV